MATLHTAYRLTGATTSSISTSTTPSWLTPSRSMSPQALQPTG